jgi:hypothetical protein
MRHARCVQAQAAEGRVDALDEAMRRTATAAAAIHRAATAKQGAVRLDSIRFDSIRFDSIRRGWVHFMQAIRAGWGGGRKGLR